MAHWRTFLDGEAHVGRYMPWREVARTTGLSRTTAWRLQKRDDFPAPYAISPGRVGYREEEVEAWCASRGHSAPRTRPAPDQRGEDSPRVGWPDAAASERPPPAAACKTEPAPARHPSRPREPHRRRTQHARAIAQQMLFDF